jgi:uncharacterized protein (DUF1015 family)
VCQCCAVPRFEPFAGLRYAADTVDLADVVAPPYDVIDDAGRATLAERSPFNSVRLELPVDEDGRDRYTSAQCLLDAWVEKGVLRRDDEPAFYVYRMGFHDPDGRARQTAGVIGAMALPQPGDADVLPHERTMSKPKDDRLNLLRACQANLSPVWCLSLAAGLSGLCELPGPPDARATDGDGVHHRLWRITQPGVVEAIAAAVAREPVVIADGHHRFETALAYRDEVGGAGGHNSLMTYVVELADEQLCVRPIHRLVTAVPDGIDLLEILATHFELFAEEVNAARMADAGALGVVTPDGAFLLRPLSTVPDDATDSMLLDVALGDVGGIELGYHHDAGRVAAAVTGGEARYGLLLRPPTIPQIAAAARVRRRMPEKTTFFHPKPRTGMVFRPLD